MSDTVLISQRGGILTLTLNRPEALNAINRELGQTLLQCLEDAELNESVRVVVIEGAGRALCAGDDVRGGSGPPSDGVRPRSEPIAHARYTPYYNIIKRIRTLAKPVIVRAHGYAMGAGADLVMASDFCVAADNLQLGFVFVKRGIVGGTFFLSKHVGLKLATRLLLTGDTLTGTEAAALGLVTESVPESELDAAVQHWAERMEAAPTRAVGYLKNGLNFGLTNDMERSIEFQAYQQAFASRTEDVTEGRAAFNDRRQPAFKGI